MRTLTLAVSGGRSVTVSFKRAVVAEVVTYALLFAAGVATGLLF